MIALLLDHLWQSTLFAAGAGLLTLAFTRNSAAIRFWLWFAASAKFLIPFAPLMALGGMLFRAAAPAPSAMVAGFKLVAMPFAGPAPVLATATPIATSAATPIVASVGAPVVAAAAASIPWASLLLALWALGLAIILFVRLARWWNLRAIVAAATPLSIAASLPAKASAASMEPGLVGIWRPVLLLPQGITERLTPPELDAILAHEACHLRRRDNLLAAIHMGVEGLFWFHPLVWWLGTRLIVERENACDEAVLSAGNDAQVYAEGILKVCKFYLHSPLACAAGVAGADLKQRVEKIMDSRIALPLNRIKKSLLAASATIVLAGPLAVGLLTTPPAIAPALAQAADGPHPGTEAALRHQIQAWENQKPDTTKLGPPMVLAVSLEQADIQRTINEWGPLQSITFKGIGPQSATVPEGWDMYFVQFQNSGSLWSIAPLGADGKIWAMSFGVAFQRDGTNTPSPGTEAALRRFVEGLREGHSLRPDEVQAASHAGPLSFRQEGGPLYDVLTPAMADRLTKLNGNNVEDVQPLIHFMKADAGTLGAPKSFAFQNVDARGMDVYQVTYEHGRVQWAISPLTDGKADFVMNFQSRFDVQPNPKAEASLRRYIASLESGRPDYGALTPDLADVARMQSRETLAGIKSLGALKSLAFTGRGDWYADLYDATFENGKANFGIALNASGKVEHFYWGVVR